jgi:hypothetical protein
MVPTTGARVQLTLWLWLAQANYAMSLSVGLVMNFVKGANYGVRSEVPVEAQTHETGHRGRCCCRCCGRYCHHRDLHHRHQNFAVLVCHFICSPHTQTLPAFFVNLTITVRDQSHLQCLLMVIYLSKEGT